MSLALAFSIILSSCAGAARPVANLPSGAAAYSVIPATPATDAPPSITSSDPWIRSMSRFTRSRTFRPRRSRSTPRARSLFRSSEPSTSRARPRLNCRPRSRRSSAPISSRSAGDGDRRLIRVAKGLDPGRGFRARCLSDDRPNHFARSDLHGEGRNRRRNAEAGSQYSAPSMGSGWAQSSTSQASAAAWPETR